MPMIWRPKNLHDMLPVLMKDGYKVGHPFQYPDDVELVYSNITPRSTRVPGATGLIAFGFQYFVMEYLLRQYNENFFGRPLDQVLRAYKRRIDNYLGPLKSYDHIADLHKLGYLPLKVKAVPEGTLVPFKVPMLTIRSTNKHFAFVTNMKETIMNGVLWKPSTSGTTSFGYRLRFEEFAERTGASREFIKWQGHDFSMRGDCGLEDACLTGAAHLLSFTGTDTIPAIDFLEMYYGADCEKELIGGSVAATEHSVMSAGGKANERETILRLITKVYPTGILSVVSDTWDFWKGLTEILPSLKAEIMSRDGKYVVRPDSGDPVKIICGDPDSPIEHVRLGAIRVLWNIFGGTTNTQGFRTLDPHVGLIYGDSITRDRQKEILERLEAMGYASDNIVLGIGSYTFVYVTRDTYGIAMKATYCERSGVGYDIFKDPLTDDGSKRSATGLLCVNDINATGPTIQLEQQVTWEREGQGILATIFEDGRAPLKETLGGIRGVIERQVQQQLQMPVTA